MLILAGLLFLLLGGSHYLTFAALGENREWLCALVRRAQATAAFAFIFSYAALAAMSVPGAAIFTIAGGFLFGPWLGTAYALTGATIGATIVFLAARAGLAGLAERGAPLAFRLAVGFRRHGLNYLLALRLIPIFPFWLINLAAGALGLRLSTFLLGTFFGMIPASFMYACLGNGLGAAVEQGQPSGATILLRPEVGLPILALALLALLPVLYRYLRAGQRQQET